MRAPAVLPVLNARQGLAVGDPSGTVSVRRLAERRDEPITRSDRRLSRSNGSYRHRIALAARQAVTENEGPVGIGIAGSGAKPNALWYCVNAE